MTNPYLVVHEFENAVAGFAGAKYGVAVESCTAALFLSLMWKREQGADRQTVHIPKHTYPGVACSIIHAGFSVGFTDEAWAGEYELAPLGIYDAALRFRRGMYHGGMQCLSFHVKKLLPIGRGGMILTDDLSAVEWLRKARFDGREPKPLLEDNFTMLGWNAYMEPSQAARGIQLFQAMKNDSPDDLEVEKQGYPDLSRFPIYTKGNDNA